MWLLSPSIRAALEKDIFPLELQLSLIATHADMNLQTALVVRRVKPFCFDNPPSGPATVGQQRLKRLLRINFKNPEDDYTIIDEIYPEKGMLACHQKNRLQLAVIRQSFLQTPLPVLEMLTEIEHPNIAHILDAYFHDDELYIVSEHLDLSILDLGFDRLVPEEWEIATIMAEIIKATTHLSNNSSSRSLQVDSVRVSWQGNVKLILDIHYQKGYEDIDADNEFNPGFIARTLEILMSHGSSKYDGWSQEALEFSSLKSPDKYSQHVFIKKAVSPSKLIPRIRLATQIKPLIFQNHRLES